MLIPITSVPPLSHSSKPMASPVVEPSSGWLDAQPLRPSARTGSPGRTTLKLIPSAGAVGSSAHAEVGLDLEFRQRFAAREVGKDDRASLAIEGIS